MQIYKQKPWYEKVTIWLSHSNNNIDNFLKKKKKKNYIDNSKHGIISKLIPNSIIFMLNPNKQLIEINPNK